MFKTIKSRFIFTSMLIIILFAGIPIYFLLMQFEKNFSERSEILLNSTIEMLNMGIEKIMTHQSDKDIQEIIEDIALHKNISHIRIIGHDHRILYSSNHKEINLPLRKADPYNGSIILDTLKKRAIKTVSENNTYCIIEPIMNNPECNRCHSENNIIAYLDADTKLTRAEVKFFTGSSHMRFLAIAFAISLFAGLYYVFNHFVSRPLALFRNSLDEVEKGNLDLKLEESEDEVGVLHSHFNRMTTELKESRRKVEEAHLSQLQHADRLITVGELTAEMAHEINNYMGIIMTRTDYISYEAEKCECLDDYKNDFNVILEQAHKVSKITGNILRHAKKNITVHKSCNLGQIIVSSLQILEPFLRKKRINIINRSENTLPEIPGDQLQIEQIFTNLFTNAVDTVSGKGKGEITITSRKYENKVSISIADNGEGISAENLENIFSPFFTTKKEDKGTGLGLYIVKKLCENNNAEINCISELNKGSKFTVIFNSGELND